MACPEAWTRRLLIIRVVFVSTLIALLIQITGFASPEWITTTAVNQIIDLVWPDGRLLNHIGLWQACDKYLWCVNLSIGVDLPAVFVATRTFAVFGLISGFIVTGFGFWYTFLSDKEKGRIFKIHLISSFVTGGIIAVTLALFSGALGGKHLGFSFIVTCMSAILYFINGILLSLYACFGPNGNIHSPSSNRTRSELERY